MLRISPHRLRSRRRMPGRLPRQVLRHPEGHAKSLLGSGRPRRCLPNSPRGASWRFLVPAGSASANESGPHRSRPTNGPPRQVRGPFAAGARFRRRFASGAHASHRLSRPNSWSHKGSEPSTTCFPRTNRCNRAIHWLLFQLRQVALRHCHGELALRLEDDSKRLGLDLHNSGRRHTDSDSRARLKMRRRADLFRNHDSSRTINGCMHGKFSTIECTIFHAV